MSVRIIHYIDSLGVGGAQTMMFELHSGIEKYFPQYEQIIWWASKGAFSRTYVGSYGKEAKHRKNEEAVQILTNLAERKRTVLIYHKLMNSKMDFFHQLYGIIPIIVVSHTYTGLATRNRIPASDATVFVSQYMYDKHKRYSKSKIW